MKAVRSNRYRRRRRRSTRDKAILVGIILGSVAVAAAIVIACLLIFLPRENGGTPPPGPASSQGTASTAPQSSKPGTDLSAINPNAATAAKEGPLAYQSLYPELYVPIVEKIPVKDGDKVLYLTFDDGPSSETERLLDILDQNGVKATFFVMAQGKSEENCKKWMKMIVDHGHQIGVHTYTHDYNQVYASVESYLEDFKKMHDLIYEATGQKITMFRFAGGSVNAYNQKNCKSIIEEMTRRGYTYFDWNVDSGDSDKNATGKHIYDTTMREVLQHNKSIILMHNSAAKKNTTDQVGAIVAAAKKDGYRFDVLDPSVKPFTFRIPE